MLEQVAQWLDRDDKTMGLDAIAIAFALASIGMGISVLLALIGIILALVGGVTFIFIALAVVKTSHEFEEKALRSYQQDIILSQIEDMKGQFEQVGKE